MAVDMLKGTYFTRGFVVNVAYCSGRDQGMFVRLCQRRVKLSKVRWRVCMARGGRRHPSRLRMSDSHPQGLITHKLFHKIFGDGTLCV